MRMRAHIRPLSRRHGHRAHVVEEDEWADSLGCRGGQQAAHGKVAEVTGMRLEQVFDSRHECSPVWSMLARSTTEINEKSVAASETQHLIRRQNRQG